MNIEEMEGQIKPDSEFGRVLTQLARDANTILEIGTWNGKGSTQCLVNGMTRREQSLWTFDTSFEMTEAARRRFASRGNVAVIHGAVSISHEIPAELLSDLLFLPAKIDLALIDGGEDSGWGDFWRLYDRMRIVALDDSRNTKNARTLETCRRLNWQVLAENQLDRNGWAVFRKP